MKSAILKKDGQKKALIARLSNEGRTLLVHFNEEPDGSFEFRRVSDALFEIPPPYDYESLENWWYYGNWQAVTPPSHAFKPLNTFRAEPGQIEKEMTDHDIAVVIDCFHDDVEWNVFEAE